MESLLGQFYSRIKGSQENIASEGLTYILQRSKTARDAIIGIIKNECGLTLSDLSFSAQFAGESLERPDISGYDSDGKEVLIIEAKFWAALTDNQPLKYILRIHENSALVFICPSLRLRSVFNEVLNRIISVKLEYTLIENKHFIKLENNKCILIKTWDEVLDTIKFQLIQNNEKLLISDIDQIMGFCNTIDTESFLPLQSEDFSPHIARRICSYYDLIDKVLDELKKRNFADTTGLRATPQKYGYTRFFKSSGFGVSLNIKFDYWSKWADTPIWINIVNIITSQQWSTSDEFRAKIKKILLNLNIQYIDAPSRHIHFPLYPLVNKTEDIVIDDLVKQIIQIISLLRNL